MYCKNCGKEIIQDSMFCPECGANQNTAPQGQPNQNYQQQAYQQPYQQQPYDSSQSAGKGAYICGILSIIFSFLLWFVGLILGIIAMCLGNAYKTVSKSARSGFTMGLIGLVISVVWLFISMAFGTMLFW